MHKFPNYLILFVWIGWFSFHSLCKETSAIEPNQNSSWVLVWQDEFDGETIDTKKWRVEDAALYKNNERQYYTPEDVYLENGHLVLRSRKNRMGGRDYTSGLVETKGLFTQRYGYFEVRAKLPKGRGIWPAIWMMNAVGTWPPEIDIAELIGHRPRKIHMTNHFGIYPHNAQQGSSFTGPDFSQDFHTFAVQWEPNILRWYIDDVQRFSTKHHVPDVPFYLILNTAVGGNWPGDPDGTTLFPQYHYIDYVRVYKRNTAGTAFIVTSAEHGEIRITPEKDRYPLGTVVELVAQPDIGYLFESWQGDISRADNPLRIRLEKNIKLSAVFKKDPDAPTLLSKNKKAEASSLESGPYAASNVVDGNLKTRWSSAFSDPQWITIDLGKIYRLKGIKLHWEAAYAADYDIQVSDNADEWTTLKSVTDSDGHVQNIRLENVLGRYVRLMGLKRATEWGFSLWEFEIYGKE